MTTGLLPLAHLLDAACFLGTALQLPPQLLTLPLEPLIFPQDCICPGQVAAGRDRLGTHQCLHTGRTQCARAQGARWWQESGGDVSGQHPAGREERDAQGAWQGGRADRISSSQPTAPNPWAKQVLLVPLGGPKGGGKLWEALTCFSELGSICFLKGAFLSTLKHKINSLTGMP